MILSLRTYWHLTIFALDLYFYILYLRSSFTTIINHIRFLTIINHLLHILFFAGSLLLGLKDLYKIVEKNKTPHSLINDLFALVWTVASMVGILFWSIYFYDRELILPKVHDSVYPCELNMYQHGIIAVIMWFEWLFFYHDIEFKKTHEINSGFRSGIHMLGLFTKIPFWRISVSAFRSDGSFRSRDVRFVCD